tara:strand:- start:195 stop:521 length:327 start_codon:yes stop_codon:yes gene_type:complete
MKINFFNYTISIFKKKKKKKYTTKTRALPSSLDMPTAPSGYIYRWIRAETLSTLNKLRSSYKLVKANKYRNKFPVIDKGRFKGFIGVGGLVLATIPKTRIEVRREYLN